MQSIKFSKLQGIGNDFIIIDSRQEKLESQNLKEMAISMCDRHFGIGADGLLIVWPSEKAAVKMQIFNPDGTEPEMCGNGIRCFAKYIFNITKSEERKEILSVETKAGIKVIAYLLEGNEMQGMEVDMGIPILKRSKIPMLGEEKDKVLNEALEVDGKTFQINAISMGNPHCVIFVDDLGTIDLEKIGPKIETHPIFPQSTNVEFVKINNRSDISVNVWERGAGITLACGTGACACVVAGILNKLLDTKVLVHLPGGDLEIEWEKEDNHVVMRGNAEYVFEGAYKI